MRVATEIVLLERRRGRANGLDGPHLKLRRLIWQLVNRPEGDIVPEEGGGGAEG